MKGLSTILLYASYFLFSLLFLHDTGEGLSVKVFDVGQGDAILITSPNKKKILIDGGSNFEIDRYMRNMFFPFQKCYLDAIVLSHPHADHLEGLLRLIKRCDVGVILTNNIEYDSFLYRSWLEDIKGFNVESVVYGGTFSIDGIKFFVLWPITAHPDIENINNTSVVLFMDYEKFEGLFTGDIEADALALVPINDIWPYVDGEFDLYKVPHHGALNGMNTGFVSELRPVYSVISVGKDNKFGHPEKEVLEFLGSIGRVYRTDMDGCVELRYVP